MGFVRPIPLCQWMNINAIRFESTNLNEFLSFLVGPNLRTLLKCSFYKFNYFYPPGVLPYVFDILLSQNNENL